MSIPTQSGNPESYRGRLTAPSRCLLAMLCIGAGWSDLPLFDRCFHFFAFDDAVTRLKNS
jgi:hypothetical protein